MPFKNFSMWRGRLPHWRADDVIYYVTFRYRRDLQDDERQVLMKLLLKPQGRKWDLLALSVGTEDTEIVFRVRSSPSGRPTEIADIVEPAKRKAGRQIIAKTGERFPPFYVESFDRIVRDDAELQERVEQIVAKACEDEAQQDPRLCLFLWLADSFGAA